jgi:basic membrane protein A and related proteins
VRRVMKVAALVAASALVLTACGSSNDDSSGSTSASGSSTTAKKSDVKVGLAYDIGGRGDKSFNDAAAAGLEKAKSEFGIETKELEAKPGETDAQKEERLRLLAQGGYNTVIAVGFAYATALKKVAADFPDVHFAIVDDSSIQAPNVADLVFAENEGSFLVGAAAALKTKSNHVGFVGGVNVPLIQKFQAGFDAGVKAVNPDIKVDNKYLTQPPDFSGFQDPAKGKVAGQGMYQAGADVVFAAAGSSGLGVFQAAKDANALAIGVDSDQYNTVDAALKDVILTSMVKKVDVAVYNFIQSVTKGSPLSGTQTFDLKSGGIDYATSGGKVDDIKTKLDDFKQKIISGAITVPTSVS